jgi:hypothetical protein
MASAARRVRDRFSRVGRWKWRFIWRFNADTIRSVMAQMRIA